MKACVQDRVDYIFDQSLVTKTLTGKKASADTLDLWINLAELDYLLSRPLED